MKWLEERSLGYGHRKENRDMTFYDYVYLCEILISDHEEKISRACMFYDYSVEGGTAT